MQYWTESGQGVRGSRWQDDCPLCRAGRVHTDLLAKHVPSYIENADALKQAGVDEIWCLSVNDAFVMGAWARDQKSAGKVRMLADGSGEFAKAAGLTLDLVGRGMGVRSNRYSMLVKNGKVVTLNVEAPGKFEVSDGKTLLAQAKAG